MTNETEENQEPELTPEEMIDEGLAGITESEEDAGEEQESNEEESEANPAEDEARKMGWRPEEEYEGEAPWVDAEEFVARQPLYEGLSKSSKRIKRLEDRLSKVLEHNRKIEKISYEKAKRDMKQARIEAMKDGEFEQAEELITKEKELDDEWAASEAEDTATITQEPEEFVAWKEKNSWYVEDAELKEEADTIGEAIWNLNARKVAAGDAEQLSQTELYNAVTDRIKKLHSDKPYFKTKKIPNGGEAPSNQANKPNKGFNERFNKLDPMEKELARQFARDGDLTIEEYMKQVDVDSR